MYEDRSPKPSVDWAWRLILPALILGTVWFARSSIFAWAKFPWQKTVIWGLVAIAMLDVVQTLRPPLAEIIGRFSWHVRNWWIKLRPASKQQTPPTAPADQPITSFTEDQLGFAKYAYVLARYVVRCPTPMAIGIHGEWGSGKSSLANMVRHFLTPRKEEDWRTGELRRIRDELAASNCHIDEDLPNQLLQGLELIALNAWQYASAQSLWRALILRLSQKLEEKGLQADAYEWQRRLYYSVSQEAKGEIRLSGTAVLAAASQALLAYLGSLILPSTWLLLGLRAIGVRHSNKFSLSNFDDLFEHQKYTLMRKQMESIEEFQSALRQLVERLLERKPGEALKDRKVIFFIDDLDRCLPTVALEIMETIKTFLDAEGCVYVLLCDQQLLGQGVRAKFKELFGDEDSDAYQRRGREYVEKIIQVSFQIPPTNEEQLKTYAQWALRDLNEGRELPYFGVVYATVGDNPRKVKRLCRGLELAFDMMQLALGRPLPPTSQTQIGIGQGTGEAVKTSPTSPNAPTGASPAPAPVVKSIIERQKDFAKAYCLQYGWPEALRYLRTYQVRGQADELPVPASVEALSKKKAQLTAEERNLREAHQEILKLKDEADLAIFSPLLVLVDWEEARMTGEGAVKKRNLDLWRFLRTSPYFTSVNRTDLKDYIEWSGVLAREEVREERLFPKEIIETPIEALDLSVRVYNSLKRTGITTVGEVLDLLNKGIEEPLAIRNFGDKSLEELRERLTSKGYLMPNPITEVLERNRDKLMKYPNVVGVGIGEKITGGHPTGRQAIRVYVSRKVPGGILDAHEVLPTQIAGVPTDVVETGDTSVGSGAVKIAK